MSRFCLVLLTTLTVLPGLSAQETEFWVEDASGERTTLLIGRQRGFVAVPAGELALLGWRAQVTERGIRAVFPPTGAEIRVDDSTPFFTWSDTTLQLVETPYRFSGELYFPIQLIVDFLPRRLRDYYAYEPEERTLRILNPDGSDDGEARTGARRGRSSQTGSSEPTAPRTPIAGRSAAAVRSAGPPPARVVVIDAGHGGVDPGTVSRSGFREKDVVLSLAHLLEEEIRALPNTEVYLTRERDVLIPLWQRGEMATEWKGDRPGVFISIHMNALPSSRSTRGFETYFVSEARTEHERRVAALENASMELEDDPQLPGGSDLAFILSELRNLDHQNYSSLLAELIQTELDPVHPGPNRGVKQGPFAVVTNALMPAVLVEVGFLSNRTEADLLVRRDFQQNAARAIARAIQTFFDRYPPAQSGGGGGL
jgi:N-acetylmuramoyl-L-alanine amidase